MHTEQLFFGPLALPCQPSCLISELTPPSTQAVLGAPMVGTACVCCVGCGGRLVAPQCKFARQKHISCQLPGRLLLSTEFNALERPSPEWQRRAGEPLQRPEETRRKQKKHENMKKPEAAPVERCSLQSRVPAFADWVNFAPRLQDWSEFNRLPGASWGLPALRYLKAHCLLEAAKAKKNESVRAQKHRLQVLTTDA